MYSVGDEKLILASSLAAKVLGDVPDLMTLSGKDLVGLEYEPLMRNFEKSECKKNTYKVVAADFVSSTEVRESCILLRLMVKWTIS